jgi:hypothetical protein
MAINVHGFNKKWVNSDLEITQTEDKTSANALIYVTFRKFLFLRERNSQWLGE